MTDLKDRLAALLYAEPDAPEDLDWIVARGRRAWRRHRAVTTVAGGAGAAALTASVVVPISLAGGGAGPTGISVAHDGTSPKPAPTSSQRCLRLHKLLKLPAERDQKGIRVNFKKLEAAKKQLSAGQSWRSYKIAEVRHHGRVEVVYCASGSLPQSPAPSTSANATESPSTPASPPPSASSSPPAPPYTYSASPQAISTRLASVLADRVQALGLTVNYTRPFSQESSALESGHPDYFGGNVDVHETSGYGDIGVQVNHSSTQQAALGPCKAGGKSDCQQVTLADGSILQTGRIHAGSKNLILTADVARPDGVLVQAQESNYAFGPDAGTEAHGSEPLSLDQLVTLAEDADFTF
jgi:hypothetical protein